MAVNLSVPAHVGDTMARLTGLCGAGSVLWAQRWQKQVRCSLWLTLGWWELGARNEAHTHMYAWLGPEQHGPLGPQRSTHYACAAGRLLLACTAHTPA